MVPSLLRHKRILIVVLPIGLLLGGSGCSGTSDLRQRMRAPTPDEISIRQSSRRTESPAPSASDSSPSWQNASLAESESDAIAPGSLRFWLYSAALLIAFIALADLRTRSVRSSSRSMAWMLLATAQCLLAVSYLAQSRWELIAAFLSVSLLSFLLFRNPGRAAVES